MMFIEMFGNNLIMIVNIYNVKIISFHFLVYKYDIYFLVSNSLNSYCDILQNSWSH